MVAPWGMNNNISMMPRDFQDVQQLLIFFTTGYFGDVIEPSNHAWVNQIDGWERASPKDDSEDAVDNEI